MEIIRHAWSLQSQNGFGAYCPGEIPPKFLFLKPIPLREDMIAQIPLKK
jgi:hypothetical protein